MVKMQVDLEKCINRIKIFQTITNFAHHLFGAGNALKTNAFEMVLNSGCSKLYIELAP